MKLSKHIILSSTLKVETGLRIGGSTEKVEIGGIDNTIIKDPLTGYPYIPGSSLKGKIRTLLEYSCNKVSANGNPWSLKDCGGDNADPIIRIFGNSGAENIKLGPSRIMVRDLKVHKDFLTKPPYDLIEVKTENMINRLSGTALNPRQAERVPAGVTFNMELSYRVFEGFPDGGVSDEELFYKYIPRALELLEMDCLGGCGSRGYGKVSFSNLILKDGDVEKNFTDVKEFKEYAEKLHPPKENC